MRTLVVDDVEVARELLAMLLGELGPVDRVGTGTAALEHSTQAIAAGTPYGLVCIDIGLPDMDGLDLLNFVRDEERAVGLELLGKSAKMLMVTASECGKDVMRAFREQADAYLTKPYSKASLDEQLRLMGLLEVPTRKASSSLCSKTS